MHTRALTWQLPEGAIELPYYPTDIELLVEEFAEKHDMSLTDAVEDDCYFGANYRRSLPRPINGIMLAYDRHIWEDDINLGDIWEHVPQEGISSFRDILNIHTVLFHMRSLHDPSLYTEELRLTGDNIEIDIGIKQGHVELWDRAGEPITPEEFTLLGRYFTQEPQITVEQLDAGIRVSNPMKIITTVFTAMEHYFT